jgi:small conductance mechanosensitive channel
VLGPLLALLECTREESQMKAKVRYPGIALVLILLVGGAVHPTAAQDTAADANGADDRLAGEAAEIKRNIEEKRQELNRIRGEMKGLADEDREALRKRASEVVVDIVDEVHEFAANVQAREKEGIDAAQDRDRASSLLRDLGNSLRDDLDNLQDSLNRLRQAQDSADPESAAKIEDQLVDTESRLSASLRMFLGHLDAMDEFGLDTRDDRQFLRTALTERGELLAGKILLVRDEVSRLDQRVGADPTNAELAGELQSARQRLDLIVDQLTDTTEMMESLELDTAEYQQLLFEVTGEITTGMLSRDVMAGLIGSWKDNAVEWFGTNGPRLFFKLVLFLLILVVFRVLARIARKVVAKAVERSTLEVSALLQRTAVSVTGTTVMFLGLLVALSQLGFEIGPLLAGLGVAGFIVGFALQDTLSNFAAGIMILLYRPYDVGDLIETGGSFGKVGDMSLVATTILTVDHQTLVIPNSKIWGDVIKNVTAQDIRRVDMVFGISYSDDIPHAERVLEEIVRNHDKVLDDPEPVIRLHNLGESSVDFIVRPWAKTDDYWDVYWEITREVKMRFDAEGISIPFPQRDVHIFQAAAEGGA